MRKMAKAIGACSLLLAGALLAADAPPASASDVTSPGACAFSASDQAWVDRSLAARRTIATEMGAPAFATPFTLIMFDGLCVRRSANSASGEGAVWSSMAHGGKIELPNGQTIAADVISFASEHDGAAFYVMSTPSLWRAKGVPGGPMGLDNLMTGVLLHESAHVAQFSTYMRQIGEIAERNALPETFNDDSIQERFRSNKAFSASVERESDLLFAAAVASDDKVARRLARQARHLMAARRARWFVGADAYLADAEDQFLALEGSGQWVGYHWLTAKNGADLPRAEVIEAFGRRAGWWTQVEGLALILATERIGGPGWRDDAFGKGSFAGIGMLDHALVHPLTH